jgi:predicted DCC family thiol-disulfide oxidoreductase YuxK
MSDAAPILVFDGDCAFCTRAVRFVLEHDTRQRTARFAARDGVAGRAVRARHGLEAVESLLWVEHRDGLEMVRIHSDAVLAIAVYLGGVLGLFGRVGFLVPRILRDPIYMAVARARRSLLAGANVCQLPAPEQLARMMS